MALNPTPSSTAPFPAALPKNPPSAKSKKEEMSAARLKRKAENKELHKKIKSVAMAKVTVWNWKEKIVTQSPQENLSLDHLSPRVIAAQQLKASSRESAETDIDHALSERYQESPFLIGQGTFGIIKQGYDLVSRSFVAIKKPENNPFAYQIIVHESKVLQELERRHAPHCLHLRAAFDRSSSGGVKEHVMVTDWVPVRNMYENHLNLQTRICILNYLHILSFGKQLLEYLTALSPDVIHGDLAPANLIYEMECSHLTVLDHGLSRKVNDKTTQLIQKSFYRSPEAILKGPIDCSADIWSVGCILFELFTGKPLFPVYDHKTITISSNELLQRMSLQIGLPTQKFLNKCADTSKYYVKKKSIVYFKEDLPISDIPWRDAILAAAPHRGMPLATAQGFIQLLAGMLRYENRLSAAVLLRSPLFETGISFHLGPIFESGDMITVCRAWDMHRHMESPMTIPFPSPVFQLNNTQVTRTCFHIPLRDPDDQYIVYLIRQGVSYQGQCWILKEGQTLEFVFPTAEEASAAEAL